MQVLASLDRRSVSSEQRLQVVALAHSAQPSVQAAHAVTGLDPVAKYPTLHASQVPLPAESQTPQPVRVQVSAQASVARA